MILSRCLYDQVAVTTAADLRQRLGHDFGDVRRQRFGIAYPLQRILRMPPAAGVEFLPAVEAALFIGVQVVMVVCVVLVAAQALAAG